MQGLINHGIERFVRDTYGCKVWVASMRRLNLGFAEFEPMLTYSSEITDRLLTVLSVQLERSRAELLEDIGTYLASHPDVEAIRRLLRFGGVTFVEFLRSLEELPDRARLAVPDLDLPPLELREHTGQSCSVILRPGEAHPAGFGHVMAGLLRVMADDYGALVCIDHKGGCDGTEIVAIRLLDRDFATGRAFDLGAPAG